MRHGTWRALWQEICYVLWLASITVDWAISTDSRNWQVLCGQLYIADCKDEGNIVKPYLHEKKSWKHLCLNVCGRLAWLSHVYPWRHVCDKMYQALPFLSRESLGMRLHSPSFLLLTCIFCPSLSSFPPSPFLSPFLSPPPSSPPSLPPSSFPPALPPFHLFLWTSMWYILTMHPGVMGW